MTMTLPVEVLLWFEEGGLPLPPLPADLTGGLEPVDDFLYASEAPPGKTLLMGFVGRGLQSWRFEYRLRVPGLAFALSLPYGGAFSDREAEKESLGHGFTLARLCLKAAEKGLARPGLENGLLEVIYDEDVCSSSYLAPGGEILFEGADLDALLDILESSRPFDAENAANMLRV